MSDLVGNPEDRFSRVAAHLKINLMKLCSYSVCVLLTFFHVIEMPKKLHRNFSRCIRKPTISTCENKDAD